MKKLIYTHPKYGHKEAVTDAPTMAEDQATQGLFEEIMREGYGGNIPPVFLAEYEDGTTRKFESKDAEEIMRDPNIREVVVVAPLVGG